MSIFYEALNVLLRHFRHVALAILLPLSAMLLLAYLPSGEGWIAVLLVTAVQTMLYVCIAITVHRIVLLGPDSVPAFGVMLYLSKRELKFASLLVLFFALIFALVLLMKSSFIFWIFAIAGLIFSIPVFSIVFPATAVDSDHGFFELLATGRYYYWLLLRAVLLIPIIVGVLSEALEKAAYQLFGDLPILLTTIGGQLAGVAVLVLEIAVLSMAYAEIEKSESAQAVFGVE